MPRRCEACAGTGDKSFASYRHQGTFCRRCSGTGEIKDKIDELCPPCAGQGCLINRINCPSCGGRSGAGTAPQPQLPGTTASVAPDVAMRQVEACTLCGPDGKVKNTIVCEQCELGYRHKKEKDAFKCGKCGKECEGRYTPCACGKTDCTYCDGAHKRVDSKTCELCGGDGTVTPLERAKAKAK